MANARLRPMMAPIFAPVIINAAMTSVYAVIAPWIPVTVVPTSFATVAIETFMTDVSSVIRNWPAASVNSTTIAPLAAAGALPDDRRVGHVDPSPAHVAGTSEPPSSETRGPKRTNAGCDAIFPATRDSPIRNDVASRSSAGGANESVSPT